MRSTGRHGRGSARGRSGAGGCWRACRCGARPPVARSARRRHRSPGECAASRRPDGEPPLLQHGLGTSRPSSPAAVAIRSARVALRWWLDVVAPKSASTCTSRTAISYRFDQLRCQLRLAASTGADPPHTVKALGLELRAPTAHRLRSHTAPAGDLVVGDASDASRSPLACTTTRCEQGGRPGHRLERQPPNVIQLQFGARTDQHARTPPSVANSATDRQLRTRPCVRLRTRVSGDGTGPSPAAPPSMRPMIRVAGIDRANQMNSATKKSITHLYRRPGENPVATSERRLVPRLGLPVKRLGVTRHRRPGPRTRCRRSRRRRLRRRSCTTGRGCWPSGTRCS